jgi:hypothetical protein
VPFPDPLGPSIATTGTREGGFDLGPATRALLRNLDVKTCGRGNRREGRKRRCDLIGL